jgi:hypothetical protein
VDVRTIYRRLMLTIFGVAMLATYLGLAAGFLGVLALRPVSLVAIIGSAVGAVATLALLLSQGQIQQRH